MTPSLDEVGSVEDLGVGDLRNWVIDEVVEPRGAADHRGVGMDTFVVDTDTDEADNDRPRCRRLSELLEERERNHSEVVTAPTIEYLNLAEDARTGAAYLLNEEYLQRVRSETGLSCWWLDSGPRMLDPEDDFGGGVVRRRAISKALYYTSQTGTADPIDRIKNAVEGNSDVGIVVGLGGGTGSGTFLDIARELKKLGRPDVTLFAVLPQLGEHVDIGANAYAALSELEYITLTHQDYFENVVLVPYPSGVREANLDEAIVRTILSYFNLSTGNARGIIDPSADRGPGRFAPFTVAATQVLRYEGEGVKEAKSNFNEYYEQKKQLFEREDDLYDEIEEFLRKHYSGDGEAEDVYGQYDRGRGTAPRFSLEDGEVSRLHDRIEQVGELTRQEFLSSIGCTVVDDLRDDFEEARRNALSTAEIDEEEASADTVRRAIVDRFPKQAGATLGSLETDDKPENERLIELYEKEIDSIARHRDLLRAKNMLEGVRSGSDDVMESSYVSKALDQALDSGSTATSVRELEEALDTLERRSRTQRETISDLETIREAMAEECEAAIDRWEADVEEELGTLVAVYRHRDRLVELLDQLERALDGAVGTAHRAGSSGELPDSARIEFDSFEELNTKLEACGLDPLSESDVLDAVEHVWDAKREWLKDSEGGILFGGHDTEELKRNHTDHYRAIRNSDTKLVWIPAWDERPDESAKVHDLEFERRKEALRDLSIVADVETSIHDRVGSPDVSIPDVLTAEARSSLHDPDRDDAVPTGIESPEIDLEEALKGIDSDPLDESTVFDRLTGADGPVRELFETAYLGGIDEELSEARDRLDSVEATRERLEDVDALLATGVDYASFDGPDGPESISEVGGGAESDTTYIRTTRPEDSGDLLLYEDIGETDFWTDYSDRERIDRTLEEFTRRIRNELLPIRNPVIEEPEENPDNPTYDEHRLVVSLMSRALDTAEHRGGSGSDAVVESVENEFGGGLLGNIDSTRWEHVRFGGPWDLTMTMFLGGVMFDNLDVFEKAGQGYKDKYEEQLHDGGSEIINRHVHGLDGTDEGKLDYHQLIPDGCDGAYLYRRSLLNLVSDTEDKLLVLNNLDKEETLSRELLRRVEVVGFESTMDLSDSSEES